MTFVPHSKVLPRALWRPAIFFFAVAQIFLSFAPLIEGRQGPDARAHVEDLGTTLHHAHNEAECAACTARVLLASSNPQRLSPLTVLSGEPMLYGEVPVSVLSAWHVASRSRAPPSDLRI